MGRGETLYAATGVFVSAGIAAALDWLGANQSAAIAIGCFVLAGIFFCWGRYEKKKERAAEWVKDYRSRFLIYVSAFYESVSHAYGGDGWIGKCNDWTVLPLSRGGADIVDAEMLEFVDEVYPQTERHQHDYSQPSKMGEGYSSFHHVTRREMAHYLQEAGENGDSEYRRWADTWLIPKLRDHAAVIGCIVYMAIPLHEIAPGPGPSAFEWIWSKDKQ